MTEQDTTLKDFDSQNSDSSTHIEKEEVSSDDSTDTKDKDVDPSSRTLQYTPHGEELDSVHDVPDRCLSFSIEAPFAHFRKIETSSTRLTYGLPPRTTINGLIAGILGLETNSYYRLFSLTHSAISIELESELRNYSMPLKHRNTDPDATDIEGGTNKTLKIEVPKSTTDLSPEDVHQRVAHSMLRNVRYRIDVWLSTEDHYSQLKTYLQNGESYYTPTLGLSECIASIDYHGEFSPDQIKSSTDGKTPQIEVDSAVPVDSGSVTVDPDIAVTTEQTPAEMERIDNPLPNRRTTAYTAYKYREDGGALTVETEHAANVDNRTVIFK